MIYELKPKYIYFSFKKKKPIFHQKCDFSIELKPLIGTAFKKILHQST